MLDGVSEELAMVGEFFSFKDPAKQEKPASEEPHGARVEESRNDVQFAPEVKPQRREIPPAYYYAGAEGLVGHEEEILDSNGVDKRAYYTQPKRDAYEHRDPEPAQKPLPPPPQTETRLTKYRQPAWTLQDEINMCGDFATFRDPEEPSTTPFTQSMEQIRQSFVQKTKPRPEIVFSPFQLWKMTKDKRQMKVVYDQFGINPSAVLRTEIESTIPEPVADDHVVLQVQAATVSVNDCLIRRGFDCNLMNPVTLPVTPGYDVVGIIVKRGKGTKGDKFPFKTGDRVACLTKTGGNARYVSVPVSWCVAVPKQCDSAEAACMVSTYTAAYQALKSASANNPTFSLQDKNVLIVGAMDPVGQALIQLCTKANAGAVYATAPTSRHRYVRSILGAMPLPEQAQAWLQYTKGEMDLVFDCQCEDGYSSSSQSLAPDGQLVAVGMSDLLKEKEMGMLGMPVHGLWNKWKSLLSANTTVIDVWESFQEDPDTFKKNLQALFQLLKWHKLKPHIAKRISLSDVAEAHERLENFEVRGSIVCLPWRKTIATQNADV